MCRQCYAWRQIYAARSYACETLRDDGVTCDDGDGDGDGDGGDDGGDA